MGEELARKKPPLTGRLIGGNAKLEITSLNSHFTPKKLGTKCGGESKIAKVWI
jgi:hypothetical protein